MLTSTILPVPVIITIPIVQILGVGVTGGEARGAVGRLTTIGPTVTDTDTADTTSAPPLPGRADEPRWPTLRLLASPWTVAVFAIGLTIRLWVISTQRGFLLADEAYTGLQSAEVLRGQFRIIIPGLAYTAPFDSYLLAPVTALVGQDLYALKLYPSVAWGMTAVLAVATTRRLATDRAAILAGCMVWLAPGSLGVVATRGYQSYASGMAAVAATLFATVLLLERASDSDRGGLAKRSAVVGVLAGFAFYLHPMYVAALLPLLAVPSWQLRRELRSWWLPAAFGALVANGPFILWNVRNGWPSLEQPAAATDGPLDRFVRFFTELVPRAYGLRGQAGDDIFGSIGTVLLMVGLVALATWGAVALWRCAAGRSLVILAPLVGGWMLMAVFTNTAFVIDGRYAIITFPFVAVALAAGVDALVPRRRGVTQAVMILWVAVLSVPLLVNDTGFDTDDPNAGFREAVALVESKGIDRVIGYYWWVLPVEFLSDQRIRTATTANPAIVLLPDTQRLVESAPPEQIAFLFWNQEEDTSRLLMPLDRYDRAELRDVVVYTPRSN